LSIRTLVVVCALALPIPAAIAGCGSDDSSSSEDPQTVLDETFNNDTKVTSGDLKLNASLSAEGDQGGQFQVSLNGPFQGDASDEHAIPQLDLTAAANGSGAGQSIDFSGGLVVTDDNAYVEYKDQAYEVGTQAFTQLKDQMEAQAGQSSSSATGGFKEGCTQALQQAGASDTSACDVDLESWLTNLSNEGTEDVGGAQAIHIHGDANVDQILTDIGNLAAAIPSAASQGFDPSQLGAVSDAVTDASIDVYSGVDDQVLRKLDANLTIDPSQIAGGAILPISNIQISFSVEIDGLNEPQTISAPANAKPIDSLLGDLGVSPGLLGGALGGSLPGGLPGGSGGSSGSGGSGGSGNSAAYLQCLQQATSPSDINACASQL
jgi:hypothetical protein